MALLQELRRTATNYVLSNTGSLNLNGWSGAAYWTHYDPTGWYVEGVFQGTSYAGTATTQFANLATHGVGFITPLEAGYPILVPLLGPNFVLEPQAQIIWQRVSFDDANDSLGPVNSSSSFPPSPNCARYGRLIP